MIDVFKSHYKSLSKFTVVGIANSLIDLFIFYILYELFDVYYVLAHVCAFFFALTNSFYFNTMWTFRSAGRDGFFKRAVRFILIGHVGLGLSTLTIYVGGIFLGNIYFAKILAMVVSFLWNYTASWLFVFKKAADD